MDKETTKIINRLIETVGNQTKIIQANTEDIKKLKDGLIETQHCVKGLGNVLSGKDVYEGLEQYRK